MKLAIYQAGAQIQSIAERFHALEEALSQNKSDQIELVLCPELFCSAYGDASLIQSASSAPVQTALLAHLLELAQRYNVAICCGYPESDQKSSNPNIYNSAIYVSAEGRILANHRKRALPSDYEKSLFSKGHEQTVFTLPNGWRIGLLICYEAEFPEAVRACVIEGAQLISVELNLNLLTVARRRLPYLSDYDRLL